MKKIVLIFILLFLSNQFQLDAELRLIGIIEPGNFKADTGRFSDAYYVMTEAPVEVKALIYNDSNIDISNAKARVRIYQEKSDGSFDNEVFLERTIYFNISKQDSLVIDFNLASGDGEKFFPTTYYNILFNDSNFNYPEYFSKMLWNITPKYLIEIELLNSNGGNENKQSRITRFYLNVANNILLSVENSIIELDSNSTTDQIAGRLNSDSLIKNFTNIFYDEIRLNRDFCIFDRNYWDVQGTEYSTFNYLFWADGDDKPISKPERNNIISFLASGKMNYKNYLIISSQELAREHGLDGSEPDSVFLSDYLRVKNLPPGNPNGNDNSCDGIKIKGVVVGKDMTSNILSTKFNNDRSPMCGLVDVEQQGEGLARETARYYPDTIYNMNEYAGVNSNTLSRESIFMAIDWRHYELCEGMIRMCFDKFEPSSYSEFSYTYFIQNADQPVVSYYPGQTKEFRYRYGFTLRGSDWENSKTEYLANQKIVIVDAINKSLDTLITNDSGYVNYDFHIPGNTLPGAYIYYIKTPKVQERLVFVVKYGPLIILGSNNSCEFQSKLYYIYKSDYLSLYWQITNGTILSYNSDSTEITVQWGESGEGKINLEMFKDGETKQLELNVTINPKPEKPLITQVENILKSTSSFRYQWYFNNELIEGATDSIYEPQESGYYSVIITNINGCASEISEQIYFEKTINVEEKKLNKPYMEISPNPATDYIEINVWVRHAVPIENREIQIYNIYGEKIPVEAHCPDIIGMPLRIDVSNFPTGIYFIHFRNEIQKIVVIR